MSYPKELKQNFIKNAIIQIDYNYNFESGVPLDALVGFFINDLGEEYDYSSFFGSINTNQRQFTISEPYFENKTNQNIIRFSPGRININQKSYTEWENLFSELKRILKWYKSKNIIESINRVGLRYINVIPEEKLELKNKDNLKFSFYDDKHSFEHFYHFESDLLNYNIKIGENINNELTVDLDLYNYPKTNFDYEESIKNVDNLHLNLKKYFFNLFTEESVIENTK